MIGKVKQLYPLRKIQKNKYKSLIGQYSDYQYMLDWKKSKMPNYPVNTFSKDSIPYEDTLNEITSLSIPLDNKMLALKALLDLRDDCSMDKIAPQK